MLSLSQGSSKGTHVWKYSKQSGNGSDIKKVNTKRSIVKLIYFIYGDLSVGIKINRYGVYQMFYGLK
jgi:hypothetical protein